LLQKFDNTWLMFHYLRYLLIYLLSLSQLQEYENLDFSFYHIRYKSDTVIQSTLFMTKSHMRSLALARRS
jgi:hypothetical protein